MTEIVPLETRVRYHGSLDYWHGDYHIVGHRDPHEREDVTSQLTESEIEGYWPGGVAYDLWPVDLPRKFGLRDRAVYFVRRESFTILEDAHNG